VLITPVLLFLVMLVIQFGLWFHAVHVAQAAAQEGVRAARVEGGSEAIGLERAESFLLRAGPTIIREREVESTRTADEARVIVSGFAVEVVPGLRLPVKADATSPVERFRADEA
jgi:hypothetical protein